MVEVEQCQTYPQNNSPRSERGVFPTLLLRRRRHGDRRDVLLRLRVEPEAELLPLREILDRLGGERFTGVGLRFPLGVERRDHHDDRGGLGDLLDDLRGGEVCHVIPPSESERDGSRTASYSLRTNQSGRR